MSLVHWMVARDSPSEHFAKALFLRAEINHSNGYVSDLAGQKYKETLETLTLDELLALLAVTEESRLQGTPKRLASDPWTTPEHSP